MAFAGICTPLSLISDWFGGILAASFPEPVVPSQNQSLESEADPDAAAMARVAAGDPDAMEPLFNRWKLPLISFLYRSLGSRADAEDLALRTFELVYRSAHKFRSDARFSSWLFAIARNELRHELRRRRRKPAEPVPPEELGLIAIDGPAETRRKIMEMEEQLLNALQTLPEKQRTAILLTAAEELSSGEIASSLGVSPSHLNVILHRARTALRALFPSLR